MTIVGSIFALFVTKNAVDIESFHVASYANVKRVQSVTTIFLQHNFLQPADENEKHLVNAGECRLFYVLKGGSLFFAVTTPDYEPKLGFGALDVYIELYNKFIKDKKLKDLIQKTDELIRSFSSPKNLNMLTHLKREVRLAEAKMRKNALQILNNQENLEGLVSRAEKLQHAAGIFKKNGKDLKKKYKMRNFMVYSVLSFMAFVFVISTATVLVKKIRSKKPVEIIS